MLFGMDYPNSLLQLIRDLQNASALLVQNYLVMM